MNSAVISETAAYAAQVRAALADLPTEEVEELTEGLEADLAESWVENGGPLVSDPAAYAQELRQAAGLPAAGAKRGALSNIGASVRDGLRDWNTAIRNNPAGEWFLDFLVSLRPAWWILRGYAAYAVFNGAFLGFTQHIPTHILAVLACLVFVAGSVWVGSRAWNQAMRVLIVLGNIFAIYVLLLAIESAIFSFANAHTYDDFVDSSPVGLQLGGTQIENIFAYDENGELIPRVQLFDQEGNPITSVIEDDTTCIRSNESAAVTDPDECLDAVWQPQKLETGAEAWNIFPMLKVPSDPVDDLEPLTGADAVSPNPPFVKVPALGATGDAESSDGAKMDDEDKKSKEAKKDSAKD